MKRKGGVVKGVVLGIIGVVILVAVGVAIRYVSSMNNFLDKVTERKETKEYNVLVSSESSYEKVQDLDGGSIGLLKIDEKVGNAEEHLLNLIKFTAERYEEMETPIMMTSEGLLPAVVLETDRIEMIKEGADGGANTSAEASFRNLAEKLEKMRIIYTFSIELDAESVTAEEKEVTKEPFLLYISGSDSRAGVQATARSDVNILAAVNPETHKILLVSIPRDMYVQLHGTTGIKDKLTHAGVYGVNMSKTTIEDFLSVSIDATLKVSFETVVKVVDQIDGIEINSDKAMRLGVEGKNKVCEYTVGTQKVDGDCALRFARERKSYETGDRHRGENQMQVISAIVAKLSSSRGYLLNIPSILDIAADSFETSLTRDQIMAFSRMQITEGAKWGVESYSVNGTGAMLPTYSMGVNLPLYVMIPDENTVTEAREKIKEVLAVDSSYE